MSGEGEETARERLRTGCLSGGREGREGDPTEFWFFGFSVVSERVVLGVRTNKAKREREGVGQDRWSDHLATA